MQILKAQDKHIPGIVGVLKHSNKMAFSDEMLNPQDIALVAVENDQVTGFMYTGIYMRGKSAVIDVFAVDPQYAKRGVGRMLCERTLAHCRTRGVRLIYSFVRQDEWADKVISHAANFNLHTDGKPYAFIFGQIEAIHVRR